MDSGFSTGALAAYTIVGGGGVPYYNCTIMGPQNPILIIKPPTLEKESEIPGLGSFGAF